MIFTSYGFRAEILRDAWNEHIPGKNGKLLIIPLAGMTCEITGRYEKAAAVSLGFSEENITVFDDRTPDMLADMHFDVIYVCGGNTFKLLHNVRQFGLDHFIRKQVAAGALYIGVSAGAYLACPDIRYVTLLEDNNHITDDDFSSLHLTDSYVLCHYDQHGYTTLRQCREFLGKDVLTIENDRMVIV